MLEPATVEKAEAEIDTIVARQALNEAKGELHELIYGTLGDLRRGISDAEKRLSALEAETPVEAAPVVRSVWQLDRPGPENYPQETPKSMHFGSADVTDRPLSAGDAPEPNVVIPRAAPKRGDAPVRGGEGS